MRILLTVVVVVLLLPNKGWPVGVDLHWQWDNQCAECHGHSADFARKFLDIENDQLQGSHHVQGLRQFMYSHYSSDIEIDAIYEMLLAQARTKPRFKHECSVCHGSVAAFVRYSINRQGNLLLSRESGRPIRGFLSQHRQLSGDDVIFYIDLLDRVYQEVYRQ